MKKKKLLVVFDRKTFVKSIEEVLTYLKFETTIRLINIDVVIMYDKHYIFFIINGLNFARVGRYTSVMSPVR